MSTQDFNRELPFIVPTSREMRFESDMTIVILRKSVIKNACSSPDEGKSNY